MNIVPAQISLLDYYNKVTDIIVTASLSVAVSYEYLAVCSCGFRKFRKDRDSRLYVLNSCSFHFYSGKLNLCRSRYSNSLSLRVYLW